MRMDTFGLVEQFIIYIINFVNKELATISYPFLPSFQANGKAAVIKSYKTLLHHCVSSASSLFYDNGLVHYFQTSFLYSSNRSAGSSIMFC